MSEQTVENKPTIAVIGGDGIGPEVVAEGLKVLDAVVGDSAFEFCFVLKEVELGPNVITIGRKAFASTRQVENATATSAGGSPDPDGEDSRRDR